MAVETDVHRARTRVRTEREAVDERASAFEAFVERVSDIAVEGPARQSGVAAAVGTRPRRDGSAGDGRRRVLAAFAETVRPRSVGDVGGTEPLLETVRTELSDDVAVALAPTTNATLTAELKRAVVADAEAGLAEAKAAGEALRREAAFLERAVATADDVTAWIAEADETPLTALGFDALGSRHRTLTRHRDDCERLVAERQSFLDGATSRGPRAEVSHRELAAYVYQEFSTDHPALSTLARLDGVCAECQRAVRDHLVRRA